MLRAVAQGDRAAFDALYARHRESVLRIARRLARDDAEAVDIAQEAFLFVLRQPRPIDLRGRLTTLLYRVMKNAVLSRRRKDRRLTSLADDAPKDARQQRATRGEESPTSASLASAFVPALLPQAGVGPTTAWTRRFDSAVDAELWRAVDALPEPQRETLLLRIVEEMSVEEVAAALDVPIGTIKSRLHHALAALRSVPGLTGLFTLDDAGPKS